MVVFNNAMAGAAGSGGAAGYTIDNSLRLNSADSSYIQAPTMTSGKDTYTISLWSKRTRGNYYDAIFSTGVNTTAAGMFYDYSITPGAFYSYFNTRGGNTTYTSEAHRDYSAWYHIVVSVNSGTATIYVNGVEQIIDTASSAGPTANFGTLTNTLYFGVYTSSLQYPMDGYLADIHFIDGQALAETDFGEFDADTGVWNPIEYAGTYGSEGFHLDFSDNSSVSALGNDSSGNGNHCTLNNITVDQPSLNVNSYSPTVTSSLYSGVETSVLDSTNLNNFVSVATPNYGTYFWQLELGTSIPITSSVKINMESGGGTLGNFAVRLNDNSNTDTNLPVTGGRQTVTINLDTETSLTKFRLFAPSGSGYGTYLYYIMVDDVVLTKGLITTSNHDALRDSPTNGDSTLDTGLGGELPGNYCTWNAAGSHNKTNNLLSNGNLDANHLSSGWDGTFIGTFGVSSGKWYWETTWTGGTNAMIGVTEDPNYMVAYLGYGDGVGLTHTGYIYQNTTFGTTGITTGVTLSLNDVVGVALDLDNGKMWYSVNGTWLNSGDPVAGTGNYSSNLVGTFYPAFTHINGAGTAQCSANFGQRKFSYQAPSGFKCLCTANLPTPDIEDGSTAMDVVTYTGNSPSTQTISGLGFSPDLVWIKDRASGSGHRLTDTVRGATKALESYDTTAEATEVNGLTAFTSDGFTVGSQSHYNSGSLVAWTWDAGSSTVANTDGDITSQVRANPSAGFSIVSYTANGVNDSTVGHGLQAAPEMIIFKKRNGSGSWLVIHKDLNPPNPWSNLSLRLDLPNPETGAFGTVNGVAPTSTTFNTSNLTDPGTNYQNGDEMIAYCFAPVEGYSAFGKYTGNGSSDGPFVYTGFRPRFILCKQTTGVNRYWQIHDSARNEYNETNLALYPDDTLVESVTGSYDFLSNGFKLRSSASTTLNGSGETYIYAAFAENPFKYARAR